MVPIYLLLGVVCVVGGALTAAGNIFFSTGLLVFGFMILGSSFMMGFVGRQMEKQCRDLFAGIGLLAHWTFEPDEWERVKEMHRRNRRRDLTRAAMQYCGIGAVPGIALLFATVWAWISAGPFPDPFFAQIDAIVIGKILVVGVACGILLLGLSYPFFSAFTPSGGRAGEVFIGWRGACVGNLWYNSFGDGVEKVKCVRGNPSTANIQCIFYSTGRHGMKTARRTFAIPVPRGKEGAARKLARDLLNG